MKIAYFASPEIAVSTLQELNKHHEIKLVITQCDKAKGRNKKIQGTAIKEEAKNLNLTVFEAQNKNKIFEELKKHEIDLNIVFAFGMILTKEVLKYPKYGSINIHASLLPKYRGASPIQETILNGDTESGITVIQMDEKMDHGDILFTEKFSIKEDESTKSLSEKIAILSANSIIAVLEKIDKKMLLPIKQDHQKATFCKKISKEEAEIKSCDNTSLVLKKIKAFDENPKAFITDKFNKKIMIHEAEASQLNLQPGTIKIINKEIHYGTNDGSIKIKELTYEGKKRMDSKSFINGYSKLFEN